MVVSALLVMTVAAGTATSVVSSTDDRYVVARWHAGLKEPLVVEATRDNEGASVVTVRRSGDATEPMTLFSERAPGTVVALFPTVVDGGHFVVLWAGASAYGIQVLGQQDGVVSTLLDEDCDSRPEFIYYDRRHEPTIVLSEWEWSMQGTQRVYRPVRARAFGWNGKRYVASLPSAWRKRLETASPAEWLEEGQ